MTAPVQKFPMGGFADTCTGYKREPHGTNDELGTGIDAICTDCADHEEQDMRLDAERIRRQRETHSCGCAARGHAHGSRYYDCLCCYGD